MFTIVDEQRAYVVVVLESTLHFHTHGHELGFVIG